MKKLLLLILMLAAIPLQAQTDIQGNITSASTTCAAPTACVTLLLSNSAGAAIQLSGTFTGTVPFEATADGTNWAAINGTPPSSTTAVTSATAAGIWQFGTAGMRGIRARGSALSAGGVSVSIVATSSSSSRGGAGSGGAGGLTNNCGTALDTYAAYFTDAFTVCGDAGWVYNETPTAPTVSYVESDQAANGKWWANGYSAGVATRSVCSDTGTGCVFYESVVRSGLTVATVAYSAGTGIGYSKTGAVPVNFVDVQAGALSSTVNAMSVTGTLSSAAATQTGIRFNISPTGSASNPQIAQYLTLGSAYTGASATYGAYIENLTTGTGVSIVGNDANYGIYSYKPGTTTGTSIAVFGVALEGNVSIGGNFRAATAKNNATNIGVIGIGLNTGSTPIQVGGYFGLQSGLPTFTSAALMADNGATTDPIIVGRNNGTNTLVFDDSNNLLIGGATAGTSGLTLLAIKSGTAPSTAPADQIQIFSSDIGAGQAVLSVFQEYAPYGGVGVASTTKIPIIVNGQTLYILATTVQ